MKLFGSVESMRDGLDYHLARHNLLSANLAHVDTPGFRPLELERKFDKVLETAMSVTDERHLHGSKGSPTDKFKVKFDPFAPQGADGNGVNLDREASKVAANNIRYDTIAQMVAGDLSGLLWAASDGRG